MIKSFKRIIEIYNGDSITRLTVQVADTPQKREQGLKFVTALPKNEGMLFIFPSRTSGGFWMKDTYIPLSIAFVDTNGRILKIMDMMPCKGHPCPFYEPGFLYHYAIEVNLGWFERNRVHIGDMVKLH